MSTQSHEPRVKNSICLFYKIAQQVNCLAGSEKMKKMSKNKYQRLQIFLMFLKIETINIFKMYRKPIEGCQ